MDVDYRDYAALAARQEPDTDHWQAHFAHLFDSGVLRFSGLPACEFGLQLPGPPFSNDSRRAALFCVERGQIDTCCVAFDLSKVAAENFGAWLTEFSAELAREPAGVPAGLSLECSHAGMADLLQQKDALKTIPRVVRYDRTAMHLPVWDQVVAESYTDAGIAPVPSGTGQMLNTLHGREAGSAVMPLGLFEVPADTAWCLLELDARQLGNPSKLRRQLSACLRFADNLLNELEWPRPCLQLDALLNRRIALHIRGLGELVQSQIHLAGKGRTFMWLRRWLHFVRHCLMHESLLLARERGPFPDLGIQQLIAELAPRYGDEQASRIVRHRFLRHRHLLALSPFALFPADFDSKDEALYLSLLPALSCADVVSMRGSELRAQLSFNGWKQLLELTAVLGSVPGCIAHNDWR